MKRKQETQITKFINKKSFKVKFNTDKTVKLIIVHLISGLRTGVPYGCPSAEQREHKIFQKRFYGKTPKIPRFDPPNPP